MIFVVDTPVPTSVDFVRTDPNHMVAAYNNKAAYIFDLETAKPIVNFEYEPDAGECVLSSTFLMRNDLQLFYDLQLIYDLSGYMEGLSGLVVSTSGCGARGRRIKPIWLRLVLCFSRKPL